MFVIPAGMMMGANVSIGDWWLWNGIPVLLGNFIGGVLFTGILFYLSQKSFKGSHSAPASDLSVGRRDTVVLESTVLEKNI
ncbi:Formate/nitrite transporter [compost metagenome]